MPRVVRNFWIVLDVDGKETQIATGPSRKDGGFQMTIMQRDKGQVRTAFRVLGWVGTDASLVVQIFPGGSGEVIASSSTTR